MRALVVWRQRARPRRVAGRGRAGSARRLRAAFPPRAAGARPHRAAGLGGGARRGARWRKAAAPAARACRDDGGGARPRAVVAAGGAVAGRALALSLRGVFLMPSKNSLILRGRAAPSRRTQEVRAARRSANSVTSSEEP